MNFEALLAIGLFTLALGLVLYVPAHLWVRRKLRKEPHLTKRRVTKAGFLVVGVMVGIMMVGFSLQYFAPESTIGQFVETSLGRYLFALSLAVAFWPVGLVLQRLGITLVEEKQTNA